MRQERALTLPGDQLAPGPGQVLRTSKPNRGGPVSRDRTCVTALSTSLKYCGLKDERKQNKPGRNGQKKSYEEPGETTKLRTTGRKVEGGEPGRDRRVENTRACTPPAGSVAERSKALD